MFGVISHYRNASQNCPERSLHTSPTKKKKKRKITSVGEDVEKTGTLTHCCRQCIKTVQQLWKTVWWVLKKLKVESKTRSQANICVPVFIAALFIRGKCGNNHRQQMNG